MICNTIHLYYDILQKEIKTPIIDLREELRKYLIKNNVKTVTILGTPSTIKKDLYKFEGIKYINPSFNEIKQLSNTIFNFKKGFQIDKQIEIVRKIYKKYLNKGSEVIILGCTEFGVMLDKENMPKINTIDILVDYIINNLYK